MRTSKMKDNEIIVDVYEIKRQIDLAKVRIVAIHPTTGVRSARTGFVSKARLSPALFKHYYRQIEGDCVNPFESDAEAFASLSKI